MDSTSLEDYGASSPPAKGEERCAKKAVLMSGGADNEAWPSLVYDEWKDTLATLHLWLQIAGKVRLRQGPHLNHYWEATFYVTPRGLTTSPIPYRDLRTFAIDFDFVDHRLDVRDCDGGLESFALTAMSVADFYAKLMAALCHLSIDVAIYKKPNEVVEAIPFDEDEKHASYDAAYVHRFWRVLLQADRLLKVFRARFNGKASPVHFFWGAPDLAVSRFSGRKAPLHPGGFPNMPDAATRDAYSHEVSSAGFWAGGGGHEAAFYSYAYPSPEGFDRAAVQPQAAYWDAQLREFVLPYEAVRASNARDDSVLSFLQSTYDAAASLGRWNLDSATAVP